LIEANNKTRSSAKDALDLLEAAKVATEKGPVNYWDEGLVNKVVEIFETHPVCIHRNSKSRFSEEY
jgi:hypothetical protein